MSGLTPDHLNQNCDLTRPRVTSTHTQSLVPSGAEGAGEGQHGWSHLPTAEAQGGAGEVLIWKKGAVRHLVIRDLTAKAVAQCLPQRESDT
jgi:hypothetical protein